MPTPPGKHANTKKISSPHDNILFRLAFNNAALANIISIVSSGKITKVNRAACRLLGYSQKELLTQNRASIFINDRGFIKMLKKRTKDGRSVAIVRAIRKKGQQVFCEITSAIFTDKDNIEKSITTISDLSAGILKQKKIDTKKEKVVADNIKLVKSDQKKIDIENEKIVADNIKLAKSDQKKVDIENEKIVADNIKLAKSDQRKVDIKNEKIVADNIVAAKSAEQRNASDREREVTEDIAAAVSKQKKIDSTNQRKVVDNIKSALADTNAMMVANNSWIKHIAIASYDVMWDWDILSGNVYIGDSVKEIFGYHLIDNTIHLVGLNKGILKGLGYNVVKRLVIALSSTNKSWRDSFTLIRSDGTVAFVNSRATIVRNAEGEAIRLIGATQDVSRERNLERELTTQTAIKKENNDIFHLAARLSYDGIWDWNLHTGEFFLGEGFENIFGFVLDKNSSDPSNWSQYLHPDDKEAVEKGLMDAISSNALSWEHAYRFLRADGTVVNVFGRASIIRDANGKACRMIGVIHDLSRQKELEQQIVSAGQVLTDHHENFRLMFNSSSDVLYNIDMATDEIVLSNGYEKEFGYPIFPHMRPADVWGNHIHPDDREAVHSDYNRMLASGETSWKFSYRLLKADGSYANVLSSRIILRNIEGKPYQMLGSLQDISKVKVLEEKLASEIELKAIQIADAMETAKETERCDLGRELHDNINQLLSVSRLYVEMAKQGGPESQAYLSNSSQYTLTAIEEIRKLTKVLTKAGIKDLGLYDSIENLAEVMMAVNDIKITCVLDRPTAKTLNEQFKLNIFRVVQEQLNNILKHAHAKHVTIYLTGDIKFIMLVISDDGIGFDTTKKGKGSGLNNIKGRAIACNGTANFDSRPGKGCIMTMTLPLTNDKMLQIDLNDHRLPE